MSTNIINNQLNVISVNKQKFNANFSIENVVEVTQLVANFDSRTSENSHNNHASGLTYLLDDGATNITINKIHKKFQGKYIYNKK